ncbi:FGGY-family carbohydrate kinase [Tranquillimonas rosea]|uniref:FGGY-family carbohydrate kinase n=1 Tax=Tranquillimonas rosea TaxID=641238 RepID=UPI003BA9FA8B
MIVAVLDIGKTNLKVALVDPETGREIEVRKQANIVLPGPPYPHFDTEGQWTFLTGALKELAAQHAVDAVSITTHGASAALVDAEGALVLPVLDYEHDGPDATAAGYDAVRPTFEESGSPRLGAGLNLGAQLYWMWETFPETRRTRHILTLPQYWAWRLTGVAASEASSLGCHTDLWTPREARPSTLVRRMGWDELLPDLRRADDVLGPVSPDVARLTGLPPETPVLCGIHDSNASLYPHLRARSGAFSVVSTGTWVVSMAVGGAAMALNPARDTLINVSATGEAVPSARFMGGREYERIRPNTDAPPDPAAVRAVLRDRIHLLPAVEPGSGPFQGRAHGWTATPATDGQRSVALAHYLAMMTETCLSMIGAAGPIVVEGPFAANEAYLRMLAAAAGRPVEALTGSVTGTSVGAAMLALGPDGQGPAAQPERVLPDETLAAHARDWCAAVASGTARAAAGETG